MTTDQLIHNLLISSRQVKKIHIFYPNFLQGRQNRGGGGGGGGAAPQWEIERDVGLWLVECYLHFESFL